MENTSTITEKCLFKNDTTSSRFVPIAFYRKCWDCGKIKPLRQFTKDRNRSRNKGYQCRQCRSKEGKQYYQKTKPEKNIKCFFNAIKRYFGLTEEEYHKKLKQQNYLCAICRKPETHKRRSKIIQLSLDHDHNTGRLRDFLCHKCNTVIGIIEEDITILTSAIEYLKKYKSMQTPGGANADIEGKQKNPVADS